MSITKRIRSKRFTVKTQILTLKLQSRTGNLHKLMIENLSLHGICAYSSGPDEFDFDGGDIIEGAKLAADDGLDLALGRILVKGMTRQAEELHIRFYLVDTKLPIDEKLGHYLIESLDVNPHEVELDPHYFDVGLFKQAADHTDIFSRCHQFAALFKQWEQTPQYQYRSIRSPSMGPRIKLKKIRNGGRNDYIVMGSNDYLNLAAHPKVLEAAKRAIDEYGFGSTGSPLTTGLTEYHEELSHLLAKTLDKQSCLLFNSGYAANVGSIPGLMREGDLIVSDFLSHASIQDAMNMANSKSRFFKHNNVEHLKKVLKENRSKHSGCMVITEGIFSMDGDLPPLDKIVKVAKQHDARIFLDEAHSFGVVGENGLGAANLFGLSDQVDIIMGTFSKICGGIGGFIVGDKEVMDWLYWFGRSQMFSVSIPPSTAAAAVTALKIFLEDKDRLLRLKANIKQFVQGLRQLGYDISPHHPSSVIPVVVGDEEKLGKMNAHLMDSGIFVIPIVYPAVSRNSCRFRFTIMADHSSSDIDYAINVFAEAMRIANFSFNNENLPIGFATDNIINFRHESK